MFHSISSKNAFQKYLTPLALVTNVIFFVTRQWSNENATDRKIAKVRKFSTFNQNKTITKKGLQKLARTRFHFLASLLPTMMKIQKPIISRLVERMDDVVNEEKTCYVLHFKIILTWIYIVCSFYIIENALVVVFVRALYNTTWFVFMFWIPTKSSRLTFKIRIHRLF